MIQVATRPAHAAASLAGSTNHTVVVCVSTSAWLQTVVILIQKSLKSNAARRSLALITVDVDVRCCLVLSGRTVNARKFGQVKSLFHRLGDPPRTA
jgi:hypothetical protein